jgi:hypothetical protein
MLYRYPRENINEGTSKSSDQLRILGLIADWIFGEGET